MLKKNYAFLIKTVHINILSILVFSFLTTVLQANVKTPEETREACQQLIDEALAQERSSNYSAALEKLMKAELMAEENQWNDKLADIKHYIGRLYYRISSYSEALEYSQASYAIMQENEELKEKSNLPLSNIALLYYGEKKYNEAIHYLDKAYHSIKETEDRLVDKKRIATNMAIIYNRYFKSFKRNLFCRDCFK